MGGKSTAPTSGCAKWCWSRRPSSDETEENRNPQHSERSPTMRNADLSTLALVRGLRVGGASRAADPVPDEPMFEGKPLQTWVKALQDADEVARRNALRAFTALGPKAKPAVPALVEALK